jgi:hypothetical protein
MAAEAMRRPTGREDIGGHGAYSAARADQEPIERLLRRLVDRVELVERRYGETIEELQGRLGHYAERTDSLAAATSPEESDTLERLRRQLSSLADRLAQPKEPKPAAGGLESLNRALTEAAKENGGTVRVRPSPPRENAGAFDFPPLFAERAKQQIGPMPEAADPPIGGAELDRRLGEVASRLERSISEAIPIVAIESLDRRMRELAHRFDAALEQSPRLETLKHLEGQISGIEEQVARLEGHMSRIGLVEGELQSLLQHFEGTPAHLAEAAREAAKEVARLLAREGGDAAGAVERLDAIHRDLVAMKDRSDETGMRMVDTLAAVHDSLRALVTQLDRNGASSAVAATDGNSPNSSGEAKRAPISFEHGSLGSALGRRTRDTASPATTTSTETASPATSAGAAENESEKPCIDDFVAAARRAAEAAATQESGTLAALNALAAASGQEQRRKRPSLAIWTAIVIVLCAAFLYFRFEAHIEPLISPAATVPTSPVQTGTATAPKSQPAELGQPALPALPSALTPPASRSEPAAPVVPTAAPEAPEELPWRTETIPGEVQSLAVGQAIFPHRD